MKREAGEPCLSAVYVDYDNIYLSLKRKNEEAAKRFAKDASLWLREIESGRLITATNSAFGDIPRRIVMNRCYGNPVPRRNTHDNSTDMNSFPFVRHHFLRAGFEVVDCPPLTAQLKNSSDIRMVMDVRDYLTHDTYFDEFIILSGDADFTPVLHRLRAHARRTVIFANEFTAAPYTAISDGEIREADLISLILKGEVSTDHDGIGGGTFPMTSARLEDVRREIIAEVAAGVRASASPVPLEALADRALRALGHEKTVATGWAGAGSFRELLRQSLPEDIKLSDEPPYLAFDIRRHLESAPMPLEARPTAPAIAAQPGYSPQLGMPMPAPDRFAPMPAPAPARGADSPLIPARANAPAYQPAPPQPAPQTPLPAGSSAIQQSIARIQEACQAPPLSPPEYRVLFELMAKEVSENDQIGAQTLANITQRAQERGLDLRRDDVRFVLEVVSESDPWFEQGASANLFAGRFRNFVVARCRGQGLNLSADELDLVDAWFAGGTLPQPPVAKAPPQPAAHAPIAPPQAPMPHRAQQIAPPQQPAPTAPSAPSTPAGAGSRWWSRGEARGEIAPPSPSTPGTPGDGDEFPRIVRTRMRG